MKSKTIKWIRRFLVAVTIITLGHFFYYLLWEGKVFYDLHTYQKSLELKGSLGDYFSGHFTLLAFIWLSYGIIIQNKEFALQRKEFKKQNKQSKEYLVELKIQNYKSRFDRLFENAVEIEKTIQLDFANGSTLKTYIGVVDVLLMEHKIDEENLVQKTLLLPRIKNYISFLNYIYFELNNISVEYKRMGDLKKDLKQEFFSIFKYRYLIACRFYWILAFQEISHFMQKDNVNFDGELFPSIEIFDRIYKESTLLDKWILEIYKKRLTDSQRTFREEWDYLRNFSFGDEEDFKAFTKTWTFLKK